MLFASAAFTQNAGSSDDRELNLRAYTEQFITAFQDDSRALGLELVEETPRATDEANIKAMAELIAALTRNGHTYVAAPQHLHAPGHAEAVDGSDRRPDQEGRGDDQQR